MLGVPIDTGLVLDLGEGQLAVGTVTRSEDMMIALEFETPLVSDGAGGLCTRHRVSPYALAGPLPGAAAQHAAQQAAVPPSHGRRLVHLSAGGGFPRVIYGYG